MSNQTLNLNGKTFVIETGRPLQGGVSGSRLNEYLANLVSAVAPNVTTVSVANAATVNLVSRFNTLRPNGNDTTVAAATLNLPTSPTDGEVVTVVSTAAITTVSGTIANSSQTVPAVTSFTAGGKSERRFDKASGLWLVA